MNISTIAALNRYAEIHDLDLTQCAQIEDPKRRYHSWLVEALIYGLNDPSTAIKVRCYAQAREYIARLECLGEHPSSLVYDAKTELRCEWENRIRT